MSEARLRLQQAEAELKSAQAEVAQEQRREDELMLQRAVKTGRQLKDEYTACEQQFRRAAEVAQQLRNRLYECNAAMAQHIGEKPDLLDFPSNDELEAWNHRGEQLKNEHAEIRAELQNADINREQARRDAMDAFNKLQYQKQVVTNLRNKLEDPGFPRGYQGGISAV